MCMFPWYNLYSPADSLSSVRFMQWSQLIAVVYIYINFFFYSHQSLYQMWFLQLQIYQQWDFYSCQSDTDRISTAIDLTVDILEVLPIRHQWDFKSCRASICITDRLTVNLAGVYRGQSISITREIVTIICPCRSLQI